ncbi:MAG: M48 family metalloprotease [bacterium]|nr:M48 family metalloprotease [bacterium]
MAVDSKYYVHDSDKAALKALKAIPGFHQLMKAYMKVWSERQFRITNMSSSIRMNENQLAKYYNLLPPICEKLGIDIPELYLQLDVNPNSYTSGDTNPFIVITSGLLETLPEELIATVLAHECGHIACHHVLYTTMGNIILRTTESALTSYVPFGGLASLPLEVAFFYWMRCSEYSADRAAVLCDGTAEKMSEVCMRLAGFDKDVNALADKAEFMKQAYEYRDMVNSSKWDKTLEFLILSKIDHPLMTVRALECEEWANSDQYRRIQDDTYLLEIQPEEEMNANEKLGIIEEEATELKKPKAKFEMPKFNLPFGKKQPTDTTMEEESYSEDIFKSEAISVPDEIRQYKKLMDEGIITEEEFAAKKKQLLGL